MRLLYPHGTLLAVHPLGYPSNWGLAFAPSTCGETLLRLGTGLL